MELEGGGVMVMVEVELESGEEHSQEGRATGLLAVLVAPAAPPPLTPPAPGAPESGVLLFDFGWCVHKCDVTAL
ncbi:hypothetical protein CRUP_013921 [Coryphaenoides rupestris]|nr:hypothetical protein CRUP_013921 [Coryphaenoides rupestris]